MGRYDKNGANRTYNDFDAIEQQLKQGGGGGEGSTVTGVKDSSGNWTSINIDGTNGNIPNNKDYDQLDNKPEINGVKLEGNKTAEQLKILQYKKLTCSGNPLAIYDGTKKLTKTEIQALYEDPKWFIYLEYLNIVFIPSNRISAESGAFEFDGSFQSNDSAYMCRVIINNNNEVKYDQLQAVHPIIIEAEENQTIAGYQVPKLTQQDMVKIYNNYIKGNLIVIKDATESDYLTVLQVSNTGSEIYVEVNYCGVYTMTYILNEQDVVNIEYNNNIEIKRITDGVEEEVSNKCNKFYISELTDLDGKNIPIGSTIVKVGTEHIDHYEKVGENKIMRVGGVKQDLLITHNADGAYGASEVQYTVDNLQDYDYIVWSVANNTWINQEYNFQSCYFKNMSEDSYSRCMMIMPGALSGHGNNIIIISPYLHLIDDTKIGIPKFLAACNEFNVAHPLFDFSKGPWDGSKYTIRVYGIKL